MNCLGYLEQPKDPSLTERLGIIFSAITTRFLASPLAGRYIRGAHSMAHFHATFNIAQFIGFEYQQSFDLAAYEQAVDSPQFEPFDQMGNPLVKDLQKCLSYDRSNINASLDPNMEENCKYVAKPVGGVSRFNFASLGGLFHFLIPLKSDHKDEFRIDNENAKIDGLHPLFDDPREVMLRNLREWVYEEGRPLCSAGLTDRVAISLGDFDYSGSSCWQRKYSTTSLPSSADIFGEIYFTKLAFFPKELKGHTGEQIIAYENSDQNRPVYSSGLDKWLGYDSELVDSVKEGILLHALKDRISHHQCGDRSSVSVKTEEGNAIEVNFDTENCAVAGLHLVRHSYEVGAIQSRVPEEDRTLRLALEATYDELIRFAEHKKVPVLARAQGREKKRKFIDKIMVSLEYNHPMARVNTLNEAMTRDYGLRPLPGYRRSFDPKL